MDTDYKTTKLSVSRGTGPRASTGAARVKAAGDSTTQTSVVLARTADAFLPLAPPHAGLPASRRGGIDVLNAEPASELSPDEQVEATSEASTPPQQAAAAAVALVGAAGLQSSSPGSGRGAAPAVAAPTTAVGLRNASSDSSAVERASSGNGAAEPLDLTKKLRGFNWKLKLHLNASGKRLLSGAIAGGVSRTVVAPLETIRTHLMVGSTGQRSVVGTFKWILENEGWQGLFRGNGINVLRVTPSKAIELFTYDTVKRALTPVMETMPIPFPVSSIAGSTAGIASCILTYPLELVKTRLTVQRGAYRGMLHAFQRIVQEEGVLELYRGLLPSIMGVIPYAGANYFAYDTLCNLYRRVLKKKKIGNLPTLIIGSTAGAFAASATFPLEVARKQMQMGALNGRVVHTNLLQCLQAIVREKGVGGLYVGLVPSCVKLMPAAGISFMCYEALKRVLLEDEDAATRAKPAKEEEDDRPRTRQPV